MSDKTVVSLCALDDLEDGGVRRFEIGNVELAVIRIGDDVYVLEDRCSHKDVPLSTGEVDADECQLVCSLHGAAFDLETGEAATLPATRPVPIYEIRVADGDVSVVLP
ncbi:MAG: non-heme iron oxygenase ferredoxin subunit [Actinobacteria bacterium]|nr:non-heme iron oxygenase ferredoxin subunit [Actinomycetota bacterium]